MVYALVHLDTLEVRYVGFTKDPARRLEDHRKNARRLDLPVYRWWRKLDHEPRLVRLSDGGLDDEVKTIAKLQADGARLFNCTAGGEGCRADETTREKIASKLRGRKLSPEHRAKVIQSLNPGNTKGRKLSPEHRTKISKQMIGNQWNKGRKHSPEVCEAKSCNLRGNQNARGQAWTPEMRARQAERSRAARAQRFWSSKRIRPTSSVIEA